MVMQNNCIHNMRSRQIDIKVSHYWFKFIFRISLRSEYEYERYSQDIVEHTKMENLQTAWTVTRHSNKPPSSSPVWAQLTLASSE